MGESYTWYAIQHCNRCWFGPAITDSLLYRKRSGEVVWVGHTMAYDGGLESNNWAALLQGTLHTFGNVDGVGC